MKEFLLDQVLLIWILSIIVYCDRDFIVCLVSLGSLGVCGYLDDFVYYVLFCCGRFILID